MIIPSGVVLSRKSNFELKIKINIRNTKCTYTYVCMYVLHMYVCIIKTKIIKMYTIKIINTIAQFIFHTLTRAVEGGWWGGHKGLGCRMLI